MAGIQSIFGIFSLLFIAMLMGGKIRFISWKKVFSLMALHGVLMICFMKLHWMKRVFLFLGDGMEVLRLSMLKGSSAVFGYLSGQELPFSVTGPTNTLTILTFQVLPMIVLMSALFSVLFHWRILHFLMRQIAKITRYLGMGSALGATFSAKIFLSQTEVPLVVRPYLDRFTKNELFTLMTMGMTTATLVVLGLYGMFLKPYTPDAMNHLFAASLLNILAACIFSEIYLPETEPFTQGESTSSPQGTSSTLQALCHGALEGWQLMWTIVAVMLVMIAVISLGNTVVGACTSWIGYKAITLQEVASILFYPVAWCMGIPLSECHAVAGLLAIKTLSNEFVAFTYLGTSTFSSKTAALLAYCLGNFSNLTSIALQSSSLFLLIPQRKEEIATLAPKALLVSILSYGFTTAVASLIL